MHTKLHVHVRACAFVRHGRQQLSGDAIVRAVTRLCFGALLEGKEAED